MARTFFRGVIRYTDDDQQLGEASDPNDPIPGPDRVAVVVVVRPSSRDREGWLAPIVVEDPIGKSVTNPDGAHQLQGGRQRLLRHTHIAPIG